MKRLLRALLVFVVGISWFLYASNVMAMDVSFQWDANTETDLAGYRVFMRQIPANYDFTAPNWEGVETTTSLTGLSDTEDYFFVVRAYDIWGNESGNSNEVRLYRGQVPDTVPPSGPVGITITIVISE